MKNRFLKYALLFIVLSLGVLNTNLSHAFGVKVCARTYENIDKIALGVKAQFPNVTSEQKDKILTDVIQKNSVPIEDYGLKITKHPVDEQNMNDTTLYIDVVYSYVSGSSFSIPPNSDYLAVWVEAYRKGKDDVSSAIVSSKKSKKEFYPITKDHHLKISRLVDRAIDPLARILCDVANVALGQWCVFSEQSEEITFEEVSEPCVPSSEFKSIGNYLYQE